ncbi:sigma-54 interaction domain-containing protein [Dickeya ananatis]|uniref:sigma-54 interaction domain-containing protein n=2 Tax=Dickeya TaxID=204037 RepID=UPI0038907841
MSEHGGLSTSESHTDRGNRPTLSLSLEWVFNLTNQHDEAGLCDWLLTTLHLDWQPQGSVLGLVDSTGRQLVCQGFIENNPVTLELDVDDFNHPLSYVLHKNQARFWASLQGGARVGNPAFHHMLSAMSTVCGLYAIPLLSDGGKVLGTLALLDRPDRLREWHRRRDCERLAQVFCRQLSLLRELSCRQQAREILKKSIGQLRDEEYRQAQEKRVQETLLGKSASMQDLQQKICQTAEYSLSVLILGETGVGKDVVARLLHQCSGRADKPFVAINCAAIPENLIESELFGYEKGAFSDAQCRKVGLVERANGGTLFLDEVGDMPASMQAKLLRVLETHSIRPLGAEQEIDLDFRLIAATHHSLDQRVLEGQFRQDLYHRLCQCVLHVAPLRERADDIPLLSQHFIEQFCAESQKEPVFLDRALVRQLITYDFPGNVRELRNVLEVACAHTPPGQRLTVQVLPPELQARLASSTGRRDEDFQYIHDLRLAVQQRETAVIEERIRQFDGNRQLAAESLNMPKRTFNGKCLKLGITQ